MRYILLLTTISVLGLATPAVSQMTTEEAAAMARLIERSKALGGSVTHGGQTTYYDPNQVKVQVCTENGPAGQPRELWTMLTGPDTGKRILRTYEVASVKTEEVETATC